MNQKEKVEQMKKYILIEKSSIVSNLQKSSRRETSNLNLTMTFEDPKKLKKFIYSQCGVNIEQSTIDGLKDNEEKLVAQYVKGIRHYDIYIRSKERNEVE